MKNILIYVNDSLGELDWIAPFMKSEEAKIFNFYLFLNGAGSSYEEKILILEKYDLIQKNIICVNSQSKRDGYLFKVDEFLNRVLNRIKLYSFSAFVGLRYLVDVLRSFNATFVRSSELKYDYIFRDYNLKESISLSSFIQKNKEAKIIVYPHAVGLQKIHVDCPREPLKVVKADVWLENSAFSDIAKNTPAYSNVFFASGAPAFDINYKKKSLFDVDVKKALVITRDCGMAFGFTYEDAYKVFDSLLKKLDSLGYSVEVKHHPRDRHLEGWRDIQKKYTNVVELEKSLTTIEESYSVCFTLFSTAPLFLLSRSIPIFEFSPYHEVSVYKNQLPMHYVSRDNQLTHDLLELGLYQRLNDMEKIQQYLEKDNIASLSKKQFLKCQEVFPRGANLSIKNKLLELVKDDN